MSELKAYNCNEWHNEYTEFYLKSEADKVIAELKEERDWLAKDRAQAYDDLEKRAQLNIKQEESIRHQKYKRCLAMAWWCSAELGMLVSTWESKSNTIKDGKSVGWNSPRNSRRRSENCN